MRKVLYTVTVRHAGADEQRQVLSTDPTRAKEMAVARARRASKTMAERHYGEFKVVECTPVDQR